MKRWLICIMMSVLLLVGLIPAAALAFETRRGNYVEITSGETVQDDLFVSGGSVTINGIVKGDLFAVADTVVVNGTIEGNLITAARLVEIKGTVTGTTIGVGERLVISGRIDRMLISAGDQTTVTQSGTIGRSWLGAGQHLELLGSVSRTLLAAGSTLSVHGAVGRDLQATVGTLTIGEKAVVDGPVTYRSDSDARIAAGAKTGSITKHALQKSQFNFGLIGTWWSVFKFLGFLVVGLTLLALLPGLRESFPQILQSRPGNALFAGFLVLIGIPAAAVVLLITVVGIPMSLLMLTAYPILLYISQVFVAWTVGRLLGDRVEVLGKLNWMWLFVIGAAATALLIRVPYVGGLAAAVSLFCGLGGLYNAVRHRTV